MKRISTIVLMCSALALAACGDDTSGNNGDNANTNGMSNNNNAMTNGSTGGNNTNTNNDNSSTNNNTTQNNTTNNGTNNTTNNGTNNTTNNNTNGDVTPENFGTLLFETYCEAAFDCPGTDFYVNDGLRYLLNTYGTKDDCLAAAGDLAASGLFNDADYAAMIADGRASFDAQVAETCLDAISSSLCEGDFDDTACDGLLTGMVADGDNCASDAECADEESTCEGPDGQCYGTCGASLCGDQTCNDNQYCDVGDTCVDYAGAGDPCQFSGECGPSDTLVCNYNFQDQSGACVEEGSVAAGEFGGCVEGLVCNYDFGADTGTCVAEDSVAENDFCVDSSVCMDGLYCDISDDVCKPANKPAGSDCTFQIECEDGLICNFVGGNGTCIQPDSVGEGEGCFDGRACMDGLFCDYASETCLAPGSDGDTCSFNIPCEPGLACLNVDEASQEGTCGALLGNGEDCQDYTQCAAPFACINDSCSPRNAPNEVCTSDLECNSFSCDDASNSCEPVMACMLP
jgi:hypothetical protein